MRRRALLSSVAGALVTIAGCVNGGAGDAAPSPTTNVPPTTNGSPTTDTAARTSDSTPTDTATGTDPAADVAVEYVRQQWGVVTPGSPDSIGVSEPDRRFVVARVDVDGTLGREDFALAVGDRTFAPITFDGDGGYRYLYRTSWGDDHYYERGRDAGLLYFAPDAPADGDAVALTWPGGESRVEAGVRERLGTPRPPLAVALDVPETYAGDTAPTVGVEVTNEGETTGRFLGALNRVGPHIAYAPVARVTGLVDPGETRRLTVAGDWMDPPRDEDRGDGEIDVTYHLDWAGGRVSAALRSVEG